MAVHRKRKPRPPLYLSQVVVLSGLDAGSGDLGAAAEIVAAEARRLAAGWSVQVPARITVSVSGRTATITADAPPARPAELRIRHPLFGDRDYWYGPPGEPFLSPAATAKADAAAARYADKVDKMARKAGFR
jgi:hypothetical protein